MKYLSFLMIFLLLLSSSLLAWDTVEDASQMDTHKMIVEQGITILQNDMALDEDPDITTNLDILFNFLYDYKRGAVWPDYSPDKYDLSQDHFYDPYTGQNFTNGYIPDTAESQIRLFIAIAVNKWKNGDYSDAAFELGTALHFFTDLTEPHHAANQIAGVGTAHLLFEKWVDTVDDNYIINESGYETDSDYYTDTVTDFVHVTDYLTHQSDTSAMAANNLVDHTQMNSSWEEWEDAAEQALVNAQKAVALILYRFLHDVSSDNVQENPDPIGKFHVLFKVADENEAGTDDYVFFGMELADGRTVEFECDVPGNDFYRNLRWGYEFNINDDTFTAADIVNVWIRKRDYTLWGDDLKLEYISVYMKGKAVLDHPINQWLGNGGWWNSNVTYVIDVEGFFY